MAALERTRTTKSYKSATITACFCEMSFYQAPRCTLEFDYVCYGAIIQSQPESAFSLACWTMSKPGAAAARSDHVALGCAT